MTTLMTPLMMAATEENVPMLLKILSVDRNELFKRDRKGRTALDLARMARNFYAISILSKAMDSEFNDARLSSIQGEADVEQTLRETNLIQSKKLFVAIKNRKRDLAMRILEDNKLYREEIEGIGQTFFTDYCGHSGYTPLILAAGLNMIPVRISSLYLLHYIE